MSANAKDRLLVFKRRSFTFQKAIFRVAKHGLLQYCR